MATGWQLKHIWDTLITCLFCSYQHTTPPQEEYRTHHQECYNILTNWDIFEHNDLEVHTSAVFSYIKPCFDTVTVVQNIRVYANQKAWMTSEVKMLLRDRGTAFRSGDGTQYKAARAKLKRGIKGAKAAYKKEDQEPFLQ